MLREFVEKKRTLFLESAESWQDAVRISCKPLEDDGTINGIYADEIVKCISEYGPYIIILPGIAIPHSQEKSEGAVGTGISMTKFEKSVIFDKEDPDKHASVFFTIASTDSKAHQRNVRALSRILVDDNLVADLQTVSSDNDLLNLADKYCL